MVTVPDHVPIGLFKVLGVHTITTDREYSVKLQQIADGLGQSVKPIEIVFANGYHRMALSAFTEGRIVRLHVERLEP